MKAYLFLLLCCVCPAAYAQLPNYVWAKRIGGPASDKTYQIEVDAQGFVYYAGSFQGTARIGDSTYTSLGSDDGFITKIDPLARHVWIKQSKARASNWIYRMKLDP